jgi:hypothetical protein
MLPFINKRPGINEGVVISRSGALFFLVFSQINLDGSHSTYTGFVDETGQAKDIAKVTEIFETHYPE